jgi:mannosyltransferase
VSSGAVARGSATATAPEPEPGLGEAEPLLSRRGVRVILGCVLAAAIVLRFVATSPLWLDEALSVNIARVPWRDLVDALERDGAPPLYYGLLHLWTGVFGTSDVAVRALSGVLGVATLGLAWSAGRRVGGERVALAAVVVVATSPFAIRYATESRMYSLAALLVFVGMLVLRGAWERPSAGRCAAVASIVALLLYTHYWALFLLAVVGGAHVAVALVRPAARRTAVRVAVALGAGGLVFLPWVPTFLDQLAHTGTPWGEGRFLGYVAGTTSIDWAGGPEQEGFLLWFVLVGVLALGVLGRPAAGGSVTVDGRLHGRALPEAAVAVATLALAGLVTWTVDSAFQTRYTSLVFPLAVVVAARGVGIFGDHRVRAALLAAIAVLGLAGGARNAVTDRTPAGTIGDLLAAHAAPGDLVVYCPDQLGPSVVREAPPGLRHATYPRLDPPQFVDWRDYEDVLAGSDPAAVGAQVRSLAGDAGVFVVLGVGYRTHVGTCEALVAAIAGADRTPQQLLAPDEDLLDSAGLVQLSAP